MKERIGFVGLGIMGKPMARHILEAGYPLTVHNRSRKAVDELAAAGAQPATSAAEVAANSDIVFTCLPDSPDVEAVALGAGGILEGIPSEALYVDTSTIAPGTAKRVARAMREKGADMLDAPVSGGQIGAENATLSIMVGGEEASFERAKPVLETMGKTIVHVGPSGAGQVTKAANQIVVGMTHAAVAEALVLAAKSGVDPAKVVQAISGGAARCWALENRAPRVLERDFEPGFYASYHLKDLGIALEAAKDAGAVLPATSLLKQLYQSLISNGKGRLDHSAIIQVIEALSAVEVKGGREG
ncbi:MAG: 2-hydroxy-3-oxopropionate reductase [Anaerolineae bacterium]|nr:2-hydroxy-3-oxopropionate reductase [Anaerolineae bacterium]